jgi:hypothetical protein
VAVPAPCCQLLPLASLWALGSGLWALGSGSGALLNENLRPLGLLGSPTATMASGRGEGKGGGGRSTRTAHCLGAGRWALGGTRHASALLPRTRTTCARARKQGLWSAVSK